MKQKIGIVCFVVTVGAIGFNAAMMVISPRAWFRMPQWIRLSGSLTQEKFGSGRGALEVRALGLCFLAVIAWLLHTFLVPGR